MATFFLSIGLTLEYGIQWNNQQPMWDVHKQSSNRRNNISAKMRGVVLIWK